MTGQEPGKGRFSRIAVVFDPDPQKVALYLLRRLSPELAARMPDVSLDLLPTNHAGHGQELARTVVQRSIATRGVETSGKGRVRELLGVARTLPGLRWFGIERPDGAHACFDSLVLAHVHRMAKYGTVSDARVHADGKFEVNYLAHTTCKALALMTLRAVAVESAHRALRTLG